MILHTYTLQKDQKMRPISLAPTNPTITLSCTLSMVWPRAWYQEFWPNLSFNFNQVVWRVSTYSISLPSYLRNLTHKVALFLTNVSQLSIHKSKTLPILYIGQGTQLGGSSRNSCPMLGTLITGTAPPSLLCPYPTHNTAWR
jgi:hypothetical protein